MKFSLYFFFSLWLLPVSIWSQFSTDFSEGNLDVWAGDKQNFVINSSQQLQLNAPSGSTLSWMHTPVVFTDSMVWDLYLMLDFAPSTSNQLKIYLAVDAADLSSATGYYLEIGASGDQDPLELKYLENGVGTSLAASAPGLAGAEPVELTLRIIKTKDGTWQCYSIKEAVPELLFSVNHNTQPLSSLSFFGTSCKYSDTRRDKFFFDDISIQPLLPDTSAPTCLSLDLIDANSVALVFNEPLDQTIAQIAANYILTPGNLSPDAVEINEPTIALRWNQPFASQQLYTLTIQQLEDLAGNVMEPQQKTFTYINIEKALPYEILITEIMADPTPVVGLPDAEYIELFNNSNRVFNLSDYSLRVNSSVVALPDVIINGGEYIIICDEDKAGLLQGLGRTIALSSFPSLTNSGAAISILDDQNIPLHDVAYSADWYGDPIKSDGGWSLEMINPLDICHDMTNWSAADNLLGGTPGSVNTRWELVADEEGPEFISLFTAAPDKIQIRFDEQLDALLMENPASYSILPSIDINAATLLDPLTVELQLAENLQADIVYQLLPFEAYDCLGNLSVSDDTISFGLRSAPDSGDVLINEILFNPASGGSRFLEIKNVSLKFIDLSLLSIGRLKGGQNDIYATGINEILGPGEVAVFSPDPSDILFRYTVPHPERLYASSLPSWNDKTDNVSLIAGGKVIDSLTYMSSWHVPVIADQNGVSLERVSPLSPSTFSSTWHSASSTSGYATPTGENSQNLNTSGEAETPFTIENPQFSPNEDGYKDYLALNFLLDSGEEVGSVWIYDLEGREINQLISNETLGTSAIVQWDGRNADAVVAEMGIYIVFVQLWDAQGNVREYQETCALVKR